MDNFFIPKNINYECSGCGKCCSGWVVPMTTSDFQRVSTKDWSPHSQELGVEQSRLKLSVIDSNIQFSDSNLIKLDKKSIYRNLEEFEIKNTNYRYAIKVAYDEHCPFLVDNLCLIHAKYGAQEKPAICQLFPYAFTETPTGTYVSVSFVSWAVIYNTGQALSDQKDYLLRKYSDFRALFPNNNPNWSQLKMIIGQDITFENYLEYENNIFDILSDHAKPISSRLIAISQMLMSKTSLKPQINSNQKKLKPIDWNFLTNMFKIYFPNSYVKRGDADFSINRFVYESFWKNLFGGYSFKINNKNFKYDEIATIKFDESQNEISNLLYRYFYNKIFGKLYFGAGFGQLSLLTGFNHLAYLYCLLIINSKILALQNNNSEVSFMDVANSIKTLEKRFGETSVSPNTAAAFELLLGHSSRLERQLNFLLN